MTKKEDLQQELKEKVKKGIKPSDLRRLKRSKSTDDINPNPPNHLLQDQLKEKQKEVEDLRKQLEIVNNELKQTQQELDQSLAARVAGIKVFGAEHEKRTKVEKELNETIEEASEEITSSDNKISDLRKKLRETQQTIQQLNQELKWEKIKKGTSSPSSELPESLNHFKYALYSLLAVWFMLYLSNSWKMNQKTL